MLKLGDGLCGASASAVELVEDLLWISPRKGDYIGQIWMIPYSL